MFALLRYTVVMVKYAKNFNLQVNLPFVSCQPDSGLTSYTQLAKYMISAIENVTKMYRMEPARHVAFRILLFYVLVNNDALLSAALTADRIFI